MRKESLRTIRCLVVDRSNPPRVVQEKARHVLQTYVVLLEHVLDDMVFPQRDDVVLAGSKDRGRVVLKPGVGSVGAAVRAALHRAHEGLDRDDGPKGARVLAEGGDDTLPAAACADADVLGGRAAVREELLHKLILDGEEGREAHADATVVVGELGGGEADAGRVGGAAGDALALGDGGSGGGLEGRLPFFLEDFEEALDVPASAR